MINLSQKQIYAFAGAIAITLISYAFYKTIRRRATSVYLDINITGKFFTLTTIIIISKMDVYFFRHYEN